MPDEVMPNSPEARTPTGELIPQNATPPQNTTPPTATNDAPNPDKPAEAPAKPATPAGAPDKYEFKAPEGRELDNAAIEAASPVFKELGLTQEQASKLMELHDKLGGDRNAANEKAVNEQRERWKNELSADKDIGSKLPEVQANIGRAFQQMPPQQVADFKSLMDMTGLGDNPIMIKMMNSFASAFNEGKHVSGNGPSGPSQKKPDAPAPSLASAMYPNLK